MGVDYGKKRVGVAISDETGKVAFPHSVIANNEELAEIIAEICKENKAKEVIIGESNNLDGKPNLLMADIHKFRDALSKICKIPIHYEPEFWSSVQAGRWQGRTEKLDASAAAIILQSYLNRKS